MTLKKYGWNENATINNSPEIYACRMLLQSFFIYLFLSWLGETSANNNFPGLVHRKEKKSESKYLNKTNCNSVNRTSVV